MCSALSAKKMPWETDSPSERPVAESFDDWDEFAGTAASKGGQSKPSGALAGGGGGGGQLNKDKPKRASFFDTDQDDFLA